MTKYFKFRKMELETAMLGNKEVIKMNRWILTKVRLMKKIEIWYK